ncbi:MAG: HAD-IA family hydrolase [Chroococcales cyanobacterium]
MTTNVIFDFDGTIADTRDVFLDITNRLAPEFGYRPIDLEGLTQLINLNIREILKNSEISLLKLPFLFSRVKFELNKQIRQVNTVPGIESALVELHQQGYRLGILTSNNQDNVVAFLENHNLYNTFDFIYSGISLFGKAKVIRKQLLKRERLHPNKIIYVGDEIRDIQAAKKTQIKMVAVTWGFNSFQALAKYEPDYLIEQPQKLVEIINELSTSKLNC